MKEAEKDLISKLMEEYRILQDKIDKIGGFRFTIKGWSITIILGGLFAGTATKTIDTKTWVVSLMVLIVSFFSFEVEEYLLSRRFGRRAITIENVVSRVLREDARASGISDFIFLRHVPGIAHQLSGEPSVSSMRKRRRVAIQASTASRWNRLWLSARSVAGVLYKAHIIFYVIEAGLVLAVVFWHGEKMSEPHPPVIFNGAQMTIIPISRTDERPKRLIAQPNIPIENRTGSTQADRTSKTKSQPSGDPGNADPKKTHQ